MLTQLNTPESSYKEPEYKEAGMKNFMNLIRTTLNDLGVEHIQFNTQNKETLLDAQQHPEKYPTLMVRVAGYSVYFTDLGKRVQDDVISRTEHHFS
jgi:formate C-acetyltransferase